MDGVSSNGLYGIDGDGTAKNSRAQERFWKALIWASAALTLAVLFTILAAVLRQGIGVISCEFLLENPASMGRKGGIFSAIVGTFYVTGVGLALATPIGVASAIYLVEYVKKGRLVQLIRFGTESLAGVPSIVFGLFGFVFFVLKLRLGWSVLSGGLTLAFMILPTIIRTSEEAMLAVPLSYREGSLALGATKWQTVRRVVLPSAIPGIATGIILGIGRAVGETAAVLLTAGSALGVPRSLFDPARTMSVHLYVLASEGISVERAYGTATVLVILVLMVNTLATSIMRRFSPLPRGR